MDALSCYRASGILEFIHPFHQNSSGVNPDCSFPSQQNVFNLILLLYEVTFHVLNPKVTIHMDQTNRCQQKLTYIPLHITETKQKSFQSYLKAEEKKQEMAL